MYTTGTGIDSRCIVPSMEVCFEEFFCSSDDIEYNYCPIFRICCNKVRSHQFQGQNLKLLDVWYTTSVINNSIKYSSTYLPKCCFLKAIISSSDIDAAPHRCKYIIMDSVNFALEKTVGDVDATNITIAKRDDLSIAIHEECVHYCQSNKYPRGSKKWNWKFKANKKHPAFPFRSSDPQ